VVVDRGVVGLVTDDATWAVPAGGGVWLPAGSDHEVQGIDDAEVTFAYVSTSAAWPPPPAGAVTVPDLLHELVAVLSAPRARRGGRRERLEAVLLDEVADLAPVRLPVPLPTDPSARAVAAALLEDPADGRTIEQLGAAIGASARTLQRRFASETGLGFRSWRRRARVRTAMDRLAAGAPVTVVAHETGFSSTSAFIAAFRAEVGATPAAWARGRSAPR
jgi:AraC-like DNA-binding protein